MSLPESPPFSAGVDALREWLGGERERAVGAARTAPRSGLEAAAGLSAAFDALTAGLATTAAAGAEDLAVLALGEWGLARPAPAGHVEAVVVSREAGGEPQARRVAAQLAAGLASAGLASSVGCRSVPSWLRLAGENSGEAAAMLDLRLVWGDPETFPRLQAGLRELLRRHGSVVAQWIASDALARQAGEGGRVCRMEPDLSANPGGLADYDALGRLRRLAEEAGAAGAGLLSREDLDEARAAASFLAGCRCVAHGLAGEARDRLSRPAQARLAAALGYRPGESVSAANLAMRDVFQAMRLIHRALKAELAGREESALWGPRRKSVVDRRRLLGQDFVRIGGLLYLSRPDLFEGRDGGLRMLEGFALAASARVGLSQEFLKRLRDSLYAVDDAARASAEAAAAFRRVLRSRGNSAQVLQAMHESGFLGAYLPEFAELDCLITADAYHEHTVDEHSLMAVAAADALEMASAGGPDSPDGPAAPNAHAARLAAEFPRLDLVKLAALLHDLGKAKGPAGHAERAAVMIPRIAGQLRLAEDEARLVLFLVENHALLAESASARWTAEDKLLAELAERLGDSERLDALYLLTAADLAAMGREAFPAWRAEQLRDLHAKLDARMSARPARSRHGLAEEVRSLLPEGVSPREAAEHLARVPERYVLEVSPQEAALHLRLLAEMARSGDESAAVDFYPRGSHVHFWVLGGDRPRRFSQIAGAFLAAGASILSARAYTRTDGVIIDQFDVVHAGAPEGPADEGFWRAAAETVREVLAGRADLGGLLGRLRAQPAPETSRPDVEPAVTLDNSASQDYTVVDVTCADRVGLLHDLSGAIADAGGDIAFAKVLTVGGTARDVFYVRVRGAKVAAREDAGRLRAAILKVCR